ncbi:hypothetical protein CK203_015353 [Vitis vinifera]|uniref:Reverse transcriptase zinc-binding domain-containing protein n=1 Tax=Vitis vinifera TaxID=29760 RepID=A0A438JK53_VITVI|nr:hypothetical protein CK203_015353 [Vitis vinifera]
MAEGGRFKEGLLASPGGWKPRIDALMFERLKEGDVEGLEKPFTEEEVFRALSGLLWRESARPDGFSMVFWQFSWDFVTEEVMNFLGQFHETGSFVRSLNATFLVLIPKKGGAEDLKDFRPISLVGGLYKWLAKNRGAILCKLDIEKAYDHVDWDFLLAVMEKMRFGERWCRWIKWCLSTVRVKSNLEKSELISVGRVKMWMSWLMSLVTGALLGNGCGVLQMKRKALWNQVIRGKYGEERGGWRSCESREAYGFGLWKAISKWDINFDKEAWVNEVWTAEGEWGGSWNPCFNRPFNDWELEEVERLFCCLEGKKVRGDEEDKVKWMTSKDGDFSVKSLYRTMQPGSLAFFPFKIIWNSCVQPKLSFFAWEASWGRVLTLDLLQKRGWVMTNRCFLCHKSEEKLITFLFHCEKTREVWMVFLSFFGVSWVFPVRSRKPFRVEGSFVGKKRKVGGNWDVMLVLGIWKARNSIAFEDCELSIQRLKASLCIFCGRNPNCG